MKTKPIYIKKYKKIIFILLISWITNLYVRHILNIKNVVFFLLTLEWLGFTR
jgi:hypothetical protein